MSIHMSDHGCIIFCYSWGPPPGKIRIPLGKIRIFGKYVNKIGKPTVHYLGKIRILEGRCPLPRKDKDFEKHCPLPRKDKDFRGSLEEILLRKDKDFRYGKIRIFKKNIHPCWMVSQTIPPIHELETPLQIFFALLSNNKSD